MCCLVPARQLLYFFFLFWGGGEGGWQGVMFKKKLNLGSLQHNCNCAYGFADCIGRALKGSHEILKI